MANIVALLDSMWGWGGHNEAGEDAPAYFRINPDNHSGRRLYSLIGDHKLLVTNCCKTVQASANHHGTPDPLWILKNLRFLASERMSLLLVCGQVAQPIFRRSVCFDSLKDGVEMKGYFFLENDGLRIPFLCIDHPAARRWSKASIESTRQEIELLCQTQESK